jgi:hypothetical protein
MKLIVFYQTVVRKLSTINLDQPDELPEEILFEVVLEVELM